MRTTKQLLLSLRRSRKRALILTLKLIKERKLNYKVEKLLIQTGIFDLQGRGLMCVRTPGVRNSKIRPHCLFSTAGVEVWSNGFGPLFELL